jgi:L-asparaginase II
MKNEDTFAGPLIGPFFSDLPDGELRTTRKRWPKNSSPVIVNIVFEGLCFTVARAQIVMIGKDGKRVFKMAEGISRVSPLDEEKRDPIVGKEHAIQQAIRALHTRVTKRRRSHHHYRG